MFHLCCDNHESYPTRKRRRKGGTKAEGLDLDRVTHTIQTRLTYPDPLASKPLAMKHRDESSIISSHKADESPSIPLLFTESTSFHPHLEGPSTLCHTSTSSLAHMRPEGQSDGPHEATRLFARNSTVSIDVQINRLLTQEMMELTQNMSSLGTVKSIDSWFGSQGGPGVELSSIEEEDELA